MVGTDQVLCGVGVGAGGDVYAVAVVLLVGAEGVGDIEVVDGVDGEVYQGLADAVGQRVSYWMQGEGMAMRMTVSFVQVPPASEAVRRTLK